jgi:hypothetical protein
LIQWSLFKNLTHSFWFTNINMTVLTQKFQKKKRFIILNSTLSSMNILSTKNIYQHQLINVSI